MAVEHRMAAPETTVYFWRRKLSLSVDISSFRPGAAGAGWSREFKGRGIKLSAWGPAAGLGFGYGY